MSHTYTLEIETSATPQQILEATLNNTPITAITPRQARTTEYPSIIALCINPEERLVDTLGIESNIRINCAHVEQFDQINPLFLKMMCQWLKNNNGDAALTLDGERLLLFRKNGKIFLNSVGNLWVNSLVDALNALDLPYTMTENSTF